MKKNIDPIFKNKLDSPQKAPDGAWDYIQSQLPPEDDTKPTASILEKALGNSHFGGSTCRNRIGDYR